MQHKLTVGMTAELATFYKILVQRHLNRTKFNN